MNNKNKSELFNTDTGISRRNVLQGIGGLGAAGFAGVGSASTGGMGQLQMQSPSLGENPAILVFSATAGYRHDAISEAIQTIKELATEIGNEGDTDITVDVIRRDASQFPTSADELSKYDLVIWNFTTADVLDENQQDAFEAYIRNDGAYMGIHSAADTEYEWEFYGGLVGAYFEDHPVPQEAEVHITDRTHPSTDHLPPVWTKNDEWYNYRENPRGDVHVLATLDEQTYSETGYEGYEMPGFDHPIAWAQYYEGARSFYTGMGHTIDSYSNEMFRQHLKGGITWAAGYVDDGASGTIWENYTKVPLATDTRAPAVVDIAPDGRVYFVDRAGFGTGLTEQAQVKMVDQNTPDNEVTTALDITVFNELEDGLLGMLLDSDFENTGYIYLYYSPPNEQIASNQEELEFLNNAATSDSLDSVPQPEAPVVPYNLLSRYTTNDDGTIDPDSETEILRVHTQRDTCCHTGGDMHWSPDGEQLYLTTGDNTNPFQSSGYTPIDERYSRVPFDAQRSAGNTNDLRGSILRIIPQEDGSYTVPDDNLYAQLSVENGGSGENRGSDDERRDLDPSSDLPPVVGDAPPLDPDGDGLYEDVNGDGKVDHDDVVALFDHFEDSAVQDNPDAYDFNRNGRLDYDDIVELSSIDSVPALPEEVRPEIYTMGSRNPFRAAVDQATGTLYWGEYGPDASSWDPLRGPPGVVEFNKANGPGFYGWPYFHGPNIPYIDGEFATNDQGEIIFNSSGEPFDPTDPRNESPNNNGLTELPEPEEPLMHYTSVSPEEFLSGPEYAQPYLPNEVPYPELTGGGAPMAGPLYRRPEDANPYRSLPESFDGKFFIMEWNADWIKYASFDEDGTVTEIDDFLPNMDFSSPMDMKYGPDGALYLVEWGSVPGGPYTTPNNDSGVYRIDHASPQIAPAVEFANDDEVSVNPGETTTVEGTLTNTTSSTLESGEITLSAPSNSGIQISGGQDTSFDTLAPGESLSVSWQVTVPDSASGSYALMATTAYTVSGEQVERTSSITLNAGSGGGNDGGGTGKSVTIPQTGGGVASEPAITLPPSGDTYQNRTNQESVTSGPEDLSADVYLGYDANNLYVRAEVTDDVHNALSGSTMWQADSLQVAVASNGEYGPEYGFSLTDGTTNEYRWLQGNATAGLDAVQSAVTRSNSVTTYEATFPWNTLFPESKGTGDSFTFSMLINERDNANTRQAVLGWTLPGITDVKTPEALGTVTLGSGDDGGESNAIDPSTTIKLAAGFSAEDGAFRWFGRAPSSISEATNPTLPLREGETYTVVWKNLGQAPHDFDVLDSQGDTLVDSSVVSNQGATTTVKFTASAEMAQYYCSVHPVNMRGDIEIV